MQPSGSSGLPTIGRYELVSGIASGGMGAVVLARLASSGGFQRLVALKLLHREHTSDPEFLAMFLDEARIAARIHHPNVVGIQEVGESPEHGYFLVMDYVEGFPLSDVVSRLGTLPLRERLRIVGRVVIDALQGLDAAHALLDDDGRSLQVVHRDVSPQNILVGVDGIGRVTDFGIARAAGRLVTTRAGEVKGKTAYLSPESVCGQPVDARSDLFSTGVVLWEAVALRRLFAARMPLDTANNVLNMEIPSLSSLVPGVPTDLDAVCLSSLSRDPAHRFRSARAFANALESALRSADLVGESHEVGAFVTGAFVEQIAERRAAVRRVAHDTIVSSGPKSFDLFEDVTAATAAKPRLLALEATKSSSPASVAVPRPPRAEASLPPSSPEQAMPAPRVTRSAPVIPVPRAAPAPPAPLVDDDDSFDRQRTTALGDNDASPAARAAIDNYRAQMLASSAARLPAAPADAPPPRERIASSPPFLAAPFGVPFGAPAQAPQGPPGQSPQVPPVPHAWGVSHPPPQPSAPGPYAAAYPQQPQGYGAAPAATPSWPGAQAPVVAPLQPPVAPAKKRSAASVATVFTVLLSLVVTALWFVFLRGR